MKNNIHILQGGVPKSGNYWLFKILENILLQSGIRKKSYIKQQPIYNKARKLHLSQTDQASIDVVSIKDDGVYYGMSSLLSEKVRNVQNYVDNTTHVWSHSPFKKKYVSFYKKFDKIVYVIRNPRDVALSMSDFAFTPYIKKYYPHKFNNPKAYLNINLENNLIKWAENVTGYPKNTDRHNIYIIFYERLLEDPEGEIEKLAKYLDLKIKKQELSDLIEAITFKNMKKESPDPLNKGKSYRWSKEFTKLQKMRSYYLIRELINLLNYPKSEKKLTLPRVPNTINIKSINDYLFKVKKGRRSYLFRFFHLNSIIFSKKQHWR